MCDVNSGMSIRAPWNVETIGENPTDTLRLMKPRRRRRVQNVMGCHKHPAIDDAMVFRNVLCPSVTVMFVNLELCVVVGS